MIDAQSQAEAGANRSKMYTALLLTAGLAILALVAWFLNNPVTLQSAAPAPETVVISQSTLETQYGLHVYLVAVTAAGGLVDVRFTMINAEKAKSLLENPKNLPQLVIDDNIILQTSEDIAQSEITFQNGNSIGMIFSNAGSIVRPGTPVTIRFGNTDLEPILAK